MTTTRHSILLDAQHALVRSHARRVFRRRVIASGSVLAAVLVALGAALMFTRPDPGPAAPTASEMVTAVPASVDGAHPDALTERTRPIEPVASRTKPVTPSGMHDTPPRAVFEIVATGSPSADFAELLDDEGLAEALRTLKKPTGVAVIGGHARLVSNLDARDGEVIR